MTTLASIGKIVSQFAPVLGSLLPVPGMAAIGQAIAGAFGASSIDDPNLPDLIQNNPDALIKLKQIEADLVIAKLHARSEDFKTETIDRQNARGNKDRIDQIIKCISVLFTYSIIYLCMYMVANGDVQGVEHDILMMVLGAFVAQANTIKDYIFGTSAKNN